MKDDSVEPVDWIKWWEEVRKYGGYSAMWTPVIVDDSNEDGVGI